MPANELATEKRIATTLPDLPDLGHTPVHPEEALNSPGSVEIRGHPSQTRPLFEGFDPEAITAEFLIDIHDLGDGYDFQVEGISVGKR